MSELIHEELESILLNSSLAFDGKSVLITGGAGFLGSWLSEAMVLANANVVCLDNLSTGSKRNLSLIRHRRNFSFVKGDVSKPVPRGDFDFIVHGASIPAPEEYARNPVETVRANGLGTEQVLERARKSESIVAFLSTSEVYGDATQIPTPETYFGTVDPLGPRACYCESKRYGETLCTTFSKQYSMDVRIIRLFNSYGPRQDAGSSYSRVVSRFVLQALKGTDITVHGDGKQTRSFCYVSDTLRAILSILRGNTKGQVINVGSEEEVSILKLAQLIKTITGSESKIVHEKARLDDPRRRCSDISKARRLLGWSPQVGLEEGLTRTTEWFRSELKSGNIGRASPRTTR